MDVENGSSEKLEIEKEYLVSMEMCHSTFAIRTSISLLSFMKPQWLTV